MDPDHTIDVAVGIVYDDAGRVLINRRPAGKVFAGQWEFPGGKIDAGETTAEALSRELNEELGIIAARQRPLIRFSHRYENLVVRLDVNEILDYQGVPEGREGQTLDWVAPARLDAIDLLAANAAIVHAIVLPRICLITDTDRFGTERTLEMLAHHVEAQRVLVLVREKAMAGQRIARFVSRAREICRRAGSMISVHADCDFDDYGYVDGFHLPARVLQHDVNRGDARWVGASCHTVSEIRLAVEHGTDYAFLSPVGPTPSHPTATPLGWTGFKELCEPASLPIYALGGMGFEDLDTAADHGAQGVAILSAAWHD